MINKKGKIVMATTYFSSDLHFNHDRAFIYENRGFKTVEEMNETIISHFNERVQENDTLFLLGDIMLGSDYEAGAALINRLNCKNIKIIRGNHDTNKRIEIYQTLCPNVEFLGWADVIRLNKRNYYLSHYPTLVNNFDETQPFNLYGHTHQKTSFYQDMPMNYHVGVDSHNCYPVSIEEIEQDIANKIEEGKKFL